ncbi:caspase family protein [Pseudaquabacterium pictum]|uniref:Peptidase C14 caspase domain-containing protein n=1 Tax=Pseudaquabacterium pictum TaxID=2315236 RepID=A0A480APU6_9BURK|nr:caspase family protein [Rubrivivax pictus]GCL63443.1 hypothetical protein AQPW35_25240 [Rubrivivax pictus]
MRPADPTRRRIVQAGLAAALGGPALGGAGLARAQDDAPPDPGRLALVIGNREYPAGFDLPSIHTNARVVQAALGRRGFQTSTVLDADPGAARNAVERFAAAAQAAPPDATLLFYFSGHGLQVDADNLLVGAGVRPDAAADALLRGSLSLNRDLLARLPRRPQGLTVLVIDACRTDLKPSVRGVDGFNQVEAPPGCLIAFSTGAGKPAIAPKAETDTTFYTGALVQQLQTASDELSFPDLFRLVKLDVQRRMLGHPVSAVRRFAQFPFIADNSSAPIPVASARQLAAVRARASAEEQARAALARAAEDADFNALQATLWPPELLRQAEAFRRNWPASARAGAAEVAAEGAREAAGILRSNDVRLYRRSFDPAPERGEVYNGDLRRAARGDKDAAARVGRQWATTARSGPALSGYEGWMQYAAELGNGIASYELALHYRRLDQPQPAARWEARARELGYNPPPSLEHYRK